MKPALTCFVVAAAFLLGASIRRTETETVAGPVQVVSDPADVATIQKLQGEIGGLITARDDLQSKYDYARQELVESRKREETNRVGWQKCYEALRTRQQQAEAEKEVVVFNRPRPFFASGR